MSEMVVEEGTKLLVHKSESDGAYNRVTSPLNRVMDFAKTGDPFPVRNARPRPSGEQEEIDNATNRWVAGTSTLPSEAVFNDVLVFRTIPPAVFSTLETSVTFNTVSLQRSLILSCTPMGLACTSFDSDLYRRLYVSVDTQAISRTFNNTSLIRSLILGVTSTGFVSSFNNVAFNTGPREAGVDTMSVTGTFNPVTFIRTRYLSVDTGSLVGTYNDVTFTVQVLIEDFEGSPLNSRLTWVNANPSNTVTRTSNNVTEGDYSWRTTYSGVDEIVMYLVAPVDLTDYEGRTLKLDYNVAELNEVDSLQLLLGCDLSWASVDNPSGSGTLSLTVPPPPFNTSIIIAYINHSGLSDSIVDIDIDNLRIV
jgi:hypothetical protein